jgi:hypothetical protein
MSLCAVPGEGEVEGGGRFEWLHAEPAELCRLGHSLTQPPWEDYVAAGQFSQDYASIGGAGM